jgi:spore germination cell wall hydrolase CwlJ-like protein
LKHFIFKIFVSILLCAYPTIATPETVKLKHEVDCLTKAIYFEARGESIVGQIAVGLVTINRKNSSLFPSTICKVISQVKPVCQYSWYCKNKSILVPNNKESKIAKALAIDLLTYSREDFTLGALFFHSTKINPGWKNLEKTIDIGSHVFYRPL